MKHYSPRHCPQCKHGPLRDTQTRIRFETTTLAVYRCQQCQHETVAPLDAKRATREIA